jgi:hypothetical protein
MMEIVLNGNKLDFSIEDEKTVGEILGGVESECERSGMTITGISLDGTALSAGELDGLFARSPESVGRIDLDTISGTDVSAMLRSTGSRFTDLVSRLREIPVQLQTGKDLLVLETIHEFSDGLQGLYQLIPLVSLTGRPASDIQIGEISLDAWPSEVSPFLSDLLEAMKSRDTVLVGDLSEYEIAPRIEQLGAVLLAV